MGSLRNIYNSAYLKFIFKKIFKILLFSLFFNVFPLGAKLQSNQHEQEYCPWQQNITRKNNSLLAIGNAC